MKKNGFIFMEVILVSVVIMILFTAIYAEYGKMQNKVLTASKYHDIQKLYYVNEIRRFIINEDLSALTTTFDNAGANYRDITNCTDFTETAYCLGLMTKVGASTVLISGYNTNDLQSDLASFDQRFKDYINTLYYSSTETAYNSYYRLIIEFSDGDYSSLILDEY